MIQDDDGGAEEDMPDTQGAQQQDDGVSIEAQDDVLELQDNTEPLSSTPIQDVSENVQIDIVYPEPLLTTDCDSELRETSNTPSSTSVAGHVSLYIHIKV